MLVGVLTVGDVHMAIVNIVHMVIVLYGFVAAIFAVFVIVSGMLHASILGAFSQTVIVDVAFVGGVVVAIMNVVGVGRVLGGFVTALGSMHVFVRGMLSVGRVGSRRGNRGRFGDRGGFRFFLGAGAAG